MSQGIALLDEAIDLARQEKAALEKGEYDQAIELAERRGKVTNMAWNNFQTVDKDNYRQRLLKLSGLQTHLTEIASRTHETIRQKLSRSRLEKRRMQGYHLAVGQALQ